MKTKQPVRLRERVLSSGRTSLYLDIYIGGRRTYEYLNLYLMPGTDRATKAENARTMQLAEGIRSRRADEIIYRRHGIQQRTDVSLLAYIDTVTERKSHTLRPGSVASWRMFRACMARFLRGRDMYVRDCGKQFADEFARWLSTPDASVSGRTLKPSTGKCRLVMLMALLHEAHRDGILEDVDTPKMPKAVKTKRVFLTIDEVRRLAATPFRLPMAKRAFLFSCLTGLRISDIRALTWGQIQDDGKGDVRLVLNQVKTGNLQYMELSPEAVALLPPDPSTP